MLQIEHCAKLADSHVFEHKTDKLAMILWILPKKWKMLMQLNIFYELDSPFFQIDGYL